MAKEGKEVNKKEGEENKVKRGRRKTMNNEEIKKREEKLSERERKLVEKEIELGKKKAVLDAREVYLEAAKVVKEVTGKVEGIRNWVIVVLVITVLVVVTGGAGLWFCRIPVMESRITDKIAVLDQKIATLSVEKVFQYRFVAVSQKTEDRKNFGFDVEKMEGKVFTSGVSGGKNLYVEVGDTVEVVLMDTKSEVTLKKIFENVQPGDVLNFLVK